MGTQIAQHLHVWFFTHMVVGFVLLLLCCANDPLWEPNALILFCFDFVPVNI